MITIDIWLVIAIALIALVAGMIMGAMLLRPGSGMHRY